MDFANLAGPQTIYTNEAPSESAAPRTMPDRTAPRRTLRLPYEISAGTNVI